MFKWLPGWALCDVGWLHEGMGVRGWEISGSQEHVNRILVLWKFFCTPPDEALLGQ